MSAMPGAAPPSDPPAVPDLPGPARDGGLAYDGSLALNEGLALDEDLDGGGAAGAPGRPRRLRRRLRRRRLLRAAAGLLALAFVLLTAKLFVFPKRDAPARVDAIVMFAGSAGRIDLAVSLARAGHAPVLAVSQPTPQNACPVGAIPHVEVICFHPDPLTTRGEARWTAQAAAEHGWRSVLVITSTPQDNRARLRLSRCYDGQVRVMTVDPRSGTAWIYTIAYEWAATIKALVLQRDC